jgi:hypothetical protein
MTTNTKDQQALYTLLCRSLADIALAGVWVDTLSGRAGPALYLVGERGPRGQWIAVWVAGAESAGERVYHHPLPRGLTLDALTAHIREILDTEPLALWGE